MKLSERVQNKVVDALEKAESVNPDAEHHNGEKARKVFCENWPAAQAGISAATSLVTNPFIKAILAIHLLIGNALQRRICDKG